MFTLIISEAEMKVFEGLAKIVNVPTENGIEGILSNHAPMVSKISTGIMSYEDENGTRTEMTVSQGYLFVWNNIVTIAVNAVESLSEIDANRVQENIEANEEIIKTSKDKLELAEAQIRLSKELNRLQAIQKNRKTN